MRKLNTKSAVLLDVVPECRIERCYPRFLPGDRFWSQVSGTCRQAVRQKNVVPYAICDRSLSLTQLNSYLLTISIYTQQGPGYFHHLVTSIVSG